MRLRRALLFAVARGSGADTRARLIPSTSPNGFFPAAVRPLLAADDFETERFLATSHPICVGRVLLFGPAF